MEKFMFAKCDSKCFWDVKCDVVLLNWPVILAIRLEITFIDESGLISEISLTIWTEHSTEYSVSFQCEACYSKY